MVLNDHWLKYYYHNWFTGKLSDFLGLFYFPLFLSALVTIIQRTPLTRSRLFFSILLTDLSFLAIKLNLFINHEFVKVLSWLHLPSHFVMDQQDIVALISSYFTWVWGYKFIKNSNNSSRLLN